MNRKIMLFYLTSSTFFDIEYGRRSLAIKVHARKKPFDACSTQILGPCATAVAPSRAKLLSPS